MGVLPAAETTTVMSLVPDGDDPPSRPEIRQVEARVDARFQAVSARFTTVDRRFASLSERLEALELQAREVTERLDRHRKTIDGRFDATDARIDLVHDNTMVTIERTNRRQGRLLVYAVVALGAVEAGVLALRAWVA
jgi:hypothetical protein